MRDRDLYAKILGLPAPWRVEDVELDREAREVRVRASSRGKMPCPECGRLSPRHDHRERRWRHLDTCQFQTILVANVPRVHCEEHGVHMAKVPWAEPRSPFTAMFEALVIDWLLAANTSTVSDLLGLTWDEVDGVQQRAVRRGLERRQPEFHARIGVDETSAKKGHNYMTIVSSIDGGHVLYVAEGKDGAALDGFYESLNRERLDAIRVVAMDMSNAYISSTRRKLSDADAKIAFDKFHVAQLLGQGVDKVRKHEHRELLETGFSILTKTKYLWLMNPDNMKDETWKDVFSFLKDEALKTSRAWAIKEHAMSLWHYVSPTWARKGWKRWIGWAVRSRLEPMKKAAHTIRNHLGGIINAIIHKVTNAGAESLNARIQKIKAMACGFRNSERFRNAIYFHLGALDLYPATHTDS